MTSRQRSRKTDPQQYHIASAVLRARRRWRPEAASPPEKESGALRDENPLSQQQCFSGSSVIHVHAHPSFVCRGRPPSIKFVGEIVLQRRSVGQSQTGALEFEFGTTGDVCVCVSARRVCRHHVPQGGFRSTTSGCRSRCRCRGQSVEAVSDHACRSCWRVGGSLVDLKSSTCHKPYSRAAPDCRRIPSVQRVSIARHLGSPIIGAP